MKERTAVLAPGCSLEAVYLGLAPTLDVVVVLAVVGPAGKELAPLRDWITVAGAAFPAAAARKHRP
jgi:hypothetical protein